MADERPAAGGGDGARGAARRRRVRRVIGATTVLVVTPLALGALQAPLGAPAAYVVGGLAFDAVVVVLGAAVLRRHRLPMPLVRDRPPSRREALEIAGLTLATLGVSWGTTWCTVIAVYALSPAVARTLFADPPFAAASVPVATLLALDIGVLAPIAEEWLFRGALLPAWTRRYGDRHAVARTSVVFGLLHADPLGVGLFAWVAARLYVRGGSLWLPIAFHAAHNCLVLALLYTGWDGPSVDQAFGWWPLAAAGTAAGLPVVAVWLRATRFAAASPPPPAPTAAG